MLGRRKYEYIRAGPLVSEVSHFDVEIVIAKLQKYESPGSDHVPAELIQPGGETVHSEIHKFITSVWNKEELPDRWMESIVVPIQKKGGKTECS